MKPFRPGGVPLHPALVHFPIAAWTLALVADAVWLAGGPTGFWSVGWYSLAAGAATGLLAMLAGFLDYLALDAASEAAEAAQRHMRLMGTAWTLFTLDWLLREPEMPVYGLAGIGLGLLTLCAFALLVIGGHQGARLVYHFGLRHASDTERKP